MIMRARTIIILLALALIGLQPATPASAHEGEHEEPPPSAVRSDAVGIGDGFYFTGATVISPGEAPREMDAYHAAVFVQSWLGTAFFGGDVGADPPPEVPVYRVAVAGDWGGAPGTIHVYFATDGTTPFIAFGEGLVPQPASADPPPPSNWFAAPPRVIDAFNGEADLVPTAGTQQAQSTPTEPVASPGEEDEGSSSSLAWVAIAGAAVLVAIWFWLRRRRA